MVHPHPPESCTGHSTRSSSLRRNHPLQRERSFNVEGREGRSHVGDPCPCRPLPQLPCWTCETNEKVHEILRKGLPDSPLYNGQIQSIGPRYCPSIETKIVTFPDRNHHPLFLEPEGCDTNELYLNGFSSSLPMEIQIEALKKMPCFRDMVVYRPGYAIEYDMFDPTQLSHSLETKVDGLFLDRKSVV